MANASAGSCARRQHTCVSARRCVSSGRVECNVRSVHSELGRIELGRLRQLEEPAARQSTSPTLLYALFTVHCSHLNSTQPDSLSTSVVCSLVSLSPFFRFGVLELVDRNLSTLYSIVYIYIE